MTDFSSTCWIAIHGAAAGDSAERERFAQRYAPVAASYLNARWQHAGLRQEVGDAVQEVLFECLRLGGALERVDADRAGGFRAFLFGITRNVAQRFERHRVRRNVEQLDTSAHDHLPDPDDKSLAVAFDEAWARTILRTAWDQMTAQAADKGVAAVRRVDLLRARIEEARPIRDLATAWQLDADFLHHEYAQARKEYLAALRHVVTFHQGVEGAAVEAECRRLLEIFGRGRS